jgi:hypothetical protein
MFGSIRSYTLVQEIKKIMEQPNSRSMRYIILIGLLVFSTYSRAQTMTVITNLANGLRDTLKFGFAQNATLAEDNFLGEENLFMTPVIGYEGRILQRDSSHFSCAMEINDSRIYYPVNFDSKTNYRNISDTSLQNRLFELWYSDNRTDSMEVICDIPWNSFIWGAYQYPQDCLGDPPSPVGILVVQDDTVKHFKFKLQPNLGIKQFILITKPNITITALDEKAYVDNKMDIHVYPNPTSGRIFVQYPNTQEIKEIFIYDSMGKLIEQFDSISYNTGIDLSQYSKGAYIVEFVSGKGEHILKRIVKQ